MGKNTKPKDNNTISNNLLKFPKKITNKNTKKYELFNIVSETGDSIYSPPPPPIEDLDGGQIFYSVSVIRDIVRQELVVAGIQLKSEE